MPHVLPERRVVSVTGADSSSFLQGLVTSDIAALEAGQATYAALLTPQGKILFDFIVRRIADGFLIDCARSQQEALLKRLAFYKLRAKVDIGARGELRVLVSDLPEPGSFADPRSADLGFRNFSTADAEPDKGDYNARRIGLGIGDSDADIGSGELFPHEANLDQLGGVNFKKGCFVGQEVVSRMEHRGTARNRILPVQLEGPAPAKGTAVSAGGKTIGTMLSSAGDRALAILRLDRLADAAEAGDTLLTDSVPVRVIKPAWARFELIVPQPA